MILLDTHIWIWWVQGDPRLSPFHRRQIQEHEAAGLGVSVFSCWEVAKQVEIGKLRFEMPVGEWIVNGLAYPGVQLLALTPEIAVEATQLPGEFHRDPADQILVATARIHDLPMLTVDEKILDYPHVKLPTPDTRT